MFSITIAQSEKATEESQYKVYTDVSLENLYAKYFSACKKGKKLGKGLIRGALKDAPRNDENLEYSRLLIIDADAGLNGADTPTAESCHEALVSLGYSHIIYTTHSHTPNYHKYRAIVELSEDIVAHELHENVSQLINELRANGCALKYAHEMDTWSQIWFLPRSANPETYISFGYFSGTLFETIHCEETEENRQRERESSEPRESSGNTETLDEMMENIRLGKEYHQSLMNLSYQMSKDGMSRAMIMAVLRSSMESSEGAGTERWATRMKELDRLIDGGIARVEEEESDSFEVHEVEKTAAKYSPPPLPPGRLGRMISQILDCMPNPQIEFAFPMALGSVAAICGAKFNAYTNQYTGLNLNMTVVADTGFGKGQISKFFSGLFMGGLDGKIVNMSSGGGITSFMGANNYTAPKPLHRDLQLGRSRVVCMQEAGIMLGAKSGNADEFSAYVMENYVNSAHTQFSSSRSYASDENSLKPFRAPAMTLILESTEESLATSLKDMNALESGYIPRQTMFKINEKPKMNRNRGAKISDKFDDDIIEQLSKLITEASSVQAVDNFEPNVVNLSDAQFDDYCNVTDHYSGDFDGDKVSKIIASRMAHKVVKFASLCSVFNQWKGGDVSLDKESWEWGKAMGEWEMEHINHNLSYMKEENIYDYGMFHMREVIAAALHHKDTTLKQRNNKVVRTSLIKDRLTSKFKQLAQERKQPHEVFMMTTLRALEKLGEIEVRDSHPAFKKRNTPCVKILSPFNGGGE